MRKKTKPKGGFTDVGYSKKETDRLLNRDEQLIIVLPMKWAKDKRIARLQNKYDGVIISFSRLATQNSFFYRWMGYENLSYIKYIDSCKAYSDKATKLYKKLNAITGYYK